MSNISKRQQQIQSKIAEDAVYSLSEALQLLQQVSTVRFDESVEVAINLGVDPRKSDQGVRGSTVLPNGNGKIVKVAVFAAADKADEATAAGADAVGYEDLLETMQGGAIDYHVVIATPDAMPMVSKLGKVLGPRGLMPNPKMGTVTMDIRQAVLNAKGGQARYRADKNGIIHCAIGKVSFDVSALVENFQALLADLKKAKPATAKGVYLKKISISTTMGPGLVVALASV